jgi:putative DNA primase/helicase
LSARIDADGKVQGGITSALSRTGQDTKMNNFDNIPQELRERKQWVNWQPVERNGKVTKVPYGRDGKRASTTDPATWMTFEAARECDLERLGFVFRKDDPFFGVDVDECRDPETGEIAPWAQKIVDELATYTEISPSGTGLHSIGRGTLPPGGRRKGSIEMYNQDRYFCMTGNSHDGSQTTIENRQTEIDKFHADIFPKTENTGAKDPHSTEPPYLSDDEVIAKALAAKNGAAFDRLWLGETDGFPSPSEADLALCRHLAFWCGSDRVQMDRLFRTSGLMRPKWDENRGEKTYAQMTIDKAIDSCTTNCESQSKPTASLEELGAQVESIPVDTSKRELAAKLKPVLLDLAAHTPAEATALVQEMRTRFGFNADEVTSCERTIREHRKAAKNSVGRVSRSEDAPRYRAHSNGLVDIVRSDSTGGWQARSQVRAGDRRRNIPPATD